MSAIPMLDEDECKSLSPCLHATWADEPCELWTGYTTPNGYGRRTVKSVSQYAHRYAWEQANGPIPEGMVIDHLCGVRNCTNVRHMEVVTLAENTRRGAARKVKGCREHGPWDRVTPLGRQYCKRCMDAGNLRRRSRAKVAA
jgi:hypothetical protein